MENQGYRAAGQGFAGLGYVPAQSDGWPPRIAGRFESSASVAEIGKALIAAQKAVVQPKRGADNTYFNSKYATLDMVWAAAQTALNAHGIAVVQAPAYDLRDLGEVEETNSKGQPRKYRRIVGVVTLRTTLLHESGEWIANEYSGVTENIGAQGAGSVLTYLRRYALQAIAMITPEGEDDDGEQARKDSAKAAGKDAPTGDEIAAWSKALKDSADLKALAAAWEAVPEEYRARFKKLKDTRKAALGKGDAADPKPAQASAA